MDTLYEVLSEGVAKWRADAYAHPEFPAIAEILEWAGETGEGELRFLRRPQLRALETYWYLRLIEGTPHVFDLYRRAFPPGEDTQALLNALGIAERAFADANFNLDRLWAAIRDDDDFVKRHRLQALRETLALDYASYIFALAMGAGKTILIGAIVASEFAMALEYPDGPFVQNALVFAPGKTIIESLRELTQVPYDRILPPRLHKPFAASLKLTFTRDGEKDIPVVRRSTFNMVVTNTEKIRIRKETIRKGDLGPLFGDGELDEAKAEVANLRLQTIASLPHLAVFSDEAHHTYGQSLETGLKRVRQTVDYLAEKTNVVCVVNTTGTPYFQKQPLRDVVIWYGLSQGIAENILKPLDGNIRSYDLNGDAPAFVTEVVGDFFRDYRDVALPNGAPAKLALYFPQTNDLKELRPAVDAALIEAGVDPSVVLVNTNESSTDEVDAFNRLNDPTSPHRVMLLVNKGTEGWNCPSLFACALARKLKTSNNFVLQAASRCLRQVPGNTASARVYLSKDNEAVLDRQLVETYGETIQDLRGATTDRVRRQLVLRKPNLPPLRLTRHRSKVVRREPAGPLHLTKPTSRQTTMRRNTFGLAEYATAKRVLRDIGEAVDIQVAAEQTDVLTVAVDLAAAYRLDLWEIRDELTRLYPATEIPVSHVTALATQIETHTRDYEEVEEEIEVALALVKPAGFRQETDGNGAPVFTAEIAYPKGKEHLLLPLSKLANVHRSADLSFHYDPYNFDSQPEETLFEDVLTWLDVDAGEVEDVLFTGAITDPAKTDFWVDYKDTDGKWHRYTPDFLVRRKDGRVLVVEVKAENARGDAINGENGRKAMAIREWVDLNPETLGYEIVFAKTDRVVGEELIKVRTLIGIGAADGDGLRIHPDPVKIEAFCQKWKIIELAFFGSVLREDFSAASDIDVLYTLAPEARWGMKISRAADELEALLGRKVDFVSRKAVEESENYIRRRHVLEHTKVVYVA